MDYGIKVSQAGYDVKTATDEHLVFKPSFNLIKVYAQGSLSISGSVGYITITHNLGYVPQFLVYYKLSNGVTLCTGDYNTCMAQADTTSIIVPSSLAAPDPSTIYYYIFYEQA